jgi:hypothetical protein
VGFKIRKISVATEMGEFRKFRTGIRLFNRSMNLFLNEIWIELMEIWALVTPEVDGGENWGDTVKNYGERW